MTYFDPGTADDAARWRARAGAAEAKLKLLQEEIVKAIRAWETGEQEDFSSAMIRLEDALAKSKE